MHPLFKNNTEQLIYHTAKDANYIMFINNKELPIYLRSEVVIHPVFFREYRRNNESNI